MYQSNSSDANDSSARRFFLKKLGAAVGTATVATALPTTARVAVSKQRVQYGMLIDTRRCSCLRVATRKACLRHLHLATIASKCIISRRSSFRCRLRANSNCDQFVYVFAVMRKLLIRHDYTKKLGFTGRDDGIAATAVALLILA